MAKKNDWTAGEYVLTVDAYQRPTFTDDSRRTVRHVEDFVKGDHVELAEDEAIRLGNGDSIAKPDSVQAKVAKGEMDEEVAPPPDLTEEQIDARIEALKQAKQDALASPSEEQQASAPKRKAAKQGE